MTVNEKFLVATLDEEGCMKYHIRLMDWQKRFEDFGFDIVLLTNDSQVYLDEIKCLYHSKLIYKNRTNYKSV